MRCVRQGERSRRFWFRSKSILEGIGKMSVMLATAAITTTAEMIFNWKGAHRRWCNAPRAGSRETFFYCTRSRRESNESYYWKLDSFRGGQIGFQFLNIKSVASSETHLRRCQRRENSERVKSEVESRTWREQSGRGPENLQGNVPCCRPAWKGVLVEIYWRTVEFCGADETPCRPDACTHLERDNIPLFPRTQKSQLSSWKFFRGKKCKTVESNVFEQKPLERNELKVSGQ